LQSKKAVKKGLAKWATFRVYHVVGQVTFDPKNGGCQSRLNPTSVPTSDWKEAGSHPKGEVRRSWKSK
jgi:hypothetical protein